LSPRVIRGSSDDLNDFTKNAERRCARFGKACQPRPPQPALRLACPEGEGPGVPRSTQAIIMDNLGGTWTPMEAGSCAGTFDTCNLPTHTNTNGEDPCLDKNVALSAQRHAELKGIPPLQGAVFRPQPTGLPCRMLADRLPFVHPTLRPRKNPAGRERRPEKLERFPTNIMRPRPSQWVFVNQLNLSGFCSNLVPSGFGAEN